MDPLNVADFSLPPHEFPTGKRPARVTRWLQGEFLKGPICWKWLSRAAMIKGKALHVALVISFLAGLKKSRTVAVSSQRLHDFGVSRTTGYRALAELERAKLVTVDRKAGQLPRVTIQDA